MFVSSLLDMGHLQVDYRDNRLHPSEDSSLDSVVSVVVPIIICLSIIIAFLLINQKKQWVPLLCWYRTPTKVPSECLLSHEAKSVYTPVSLNFLNTFSIRRCHFYFANLNVKYLSSCSQQACNPCPGLD